MEASIRRKPIREKLIRAVAVISFVAVILTSLIGLVFMFRIRYGSEEKILEQLENNVTDLVEDRVELAKSELEKFADYVNLSKSFAERLVERPSEFSRIDVPQRSTDVDEIYLMQRSLTDENLSIDKVYDDIKLFSNLESIWDPIMKIDGELISTIYVGTEKGFMLSYDKYARLAEPSENGEVYFNHLERPWYLLAKKEGKTVFTDLDQDSFGRGLSLTCATPFYIDGKFAGAIGMDILVKDLQSQIIDINVGDGSYAFLLNDTGDIVASPFIDAKADTFENINSTDNKFYNVREEILNEKSGVSIVDDVYCAYAPIDIATWTLCVVIPKQIILNQVSAIDKIIGRMIVLFVLAFLLIMVGTFIVTMILSNKLTAPIMKLKSDIELISNGNLDIKAQLIGNDEITDLADAFNNMTSSLKNYISDLTNLTAEKERIGAELDVATHIQSSMLPNIFPPFPSDNNFDIYATMDPAKEVGGDFYDFFKLDDNNLAIVVADVSGKGVPAALFMVIGKTLIKDHTFNQNNLGDVFSIVNKILCESNSENLFITAFEAVINLKTGDMEYVNAGHELPFIYKKSTGIFKAFEMKPGFVLAGMENMKFSPGKIKLDYGDKIFQYTDGVTEATNSNNELYGMQRLEKILNKNASKSVEEILKAVKADIDLFVGDAMQFDDITMLGFEYTPEGLNKAQI